MKIPMGVSYAILAAMLFGSTTPVAKFIIRDIHPVILAAILYLGSGVGLFLTRWITGSRSREAALQRSSMPWLLGAILFGGILAPVLLMAGLKLTPASSASLL
ncbi:MAG TPA: EamA family transporter, partial [Candidatus Ozemobacteraceae bacterium]|nr:EamA family transporter [Candidatus Ozemobacteraceae bacterium]